MINVLLVGERRNRITLTEIVRAVHLFKELAFQVDQAGSLQPFDSTLLLARAHHLTSYDASYLELTLRKSLPLATLDTPLLTAAANAGIELFS